MHMPRSIKPAEATWKEKIMQLDPFGCFLVMGAVVSLILALQYGGLTHPWNSSVVIGLIVGSFLISVSFAVWEYYQGERAAIPARLLMDRNVWVPSLYTAFFAGSYFVVVSDLCSCFCMSLLLQFAIYVTSFVAYQRIQRKQSLTSYARKVYYLPIYFQR